LSNISADGWGDVLLPVIDRYRAQGQTVVVRADAAFALPALKALERRGVRYAIRLPANDVLERAIEDLLVRPRGRPSSAPPVRYRSFHYQGGTAEQWINEGEEATHWTRLSCPRFRANEVRLLLGVIAYYLGNLLRRLVLPDAIQSWSPTSLQQRLFKTGGPLIRHARYFILQLAESSLTQPLFRQIVARVEQLAWHPA